MGAIVLLLPLPLHATRRHAGCPRKTRRLCVHSWGMHACRKAEPSRCRCNLPAAEPNSPALPPACVPGQPRPFMPYTPQPHTHSVAGPHLLRDSLCAVHYQHSHVGAAHGAHRAVHAQLLRAVARVRNLCAPLHHRHRTIAIGDITVVRVHAGSAQGAQDSRGWLDRAATLLGWRTAWMQRACLTPGRTCQCAVCSPAHSPPSCPARSCFPPHAHTHEHSNEPLQPPAA